MSDTSTAHGIAASSPRRAALLRIIDALEAELRRLGYWEAVPPGRARLDSPEPFCVDTLTLPEWLQWRLIPQLRDLIEQGTALPDECAIHPYAEHCLSEEPRDMSALLGLIHRIDTLITEPDSVTPH